MVASPLPFLEVGELRTFSGAVDEHELQWHWDEQDREACATHATDWQLQLDNELPQPMPEDVWFFIPAGVWHRIIKGTGDLTVRVLKHEPTSRASRSI